ncbi:MAG TPA: hypothetical protein VHR42_04095 [Clostridia bacterium]|nr:hypothetical protein [Clostridia bacterium]
MKTNVIKLRFLRHGEPAGREYTYFTNTDVAVGDTVDLESKDGIAQGVVTQIDVPESEIAPFKDRAKTILGKASTPVKEFNVSKAISAQADYCNRTDAPDFAPLNGRCWKCHRNIYEQVGWKIENGRRIQVPLDSPELQHITGIDVEKAGKTLVTGCPHCNRSYCD